MLLKRSNILFQLRTFLNIIYAFRMFQRSTFGRKWILHWRIANFENKQKFCMWNNTIYLMKTYKLQLKFIPWKASNNYRNISQNSQRFLYLYEYSNIIWHNIIILNISHRKDQNTMMKKIEKTVIWKYWQQYLLIKLDVSVREIEAYIKEYKLSKSIEN